MQRKALLAAAVSLFTLFPLGASAGPASPQPGLWWSPAESGRGYALDPQGEKMVVTTFAYDDSGSMQWYYADGPLSNGGAHWCGQLLTFDFGQPLNGGYRGPPVNTGNAGTICIDFNGRVNGTLTLPSGRRVAIERENFGVGNPPVALLGQWAYIEMIGSTWFVDVYKFTQIAGPTSTGTGVVVDPVRKAGFEYQSSGSFAGRVVGFRFNSAGGVTDQYLYQLQMEEGRGFWVSPTTFTQYGMSAYKMYTAGGLAKSAASSMAALDLEAKGVSITEPVSVTLEELESRNRELGAIARQIWATVRSVKH